jgi:hypothetical protein
MSKQRTNMEPHSDQPKQEVFHPAPPARPFNPDSEAEPNLVPGPLPTASPAVTVPSQSQPPVARKQRSLPSEPALQTLNNAARGIRKLKDIEVQRWVIESLDTLFPAVQEVKE